MKTNELTGTALDWAVATALGRGPKYDMKSHGRTWCDWWLAAPGHEYEPMPSYSTDWLHGGVLIEREGVSVIQLERENIPDAKGFRQGKYQWGAVIGDRHSPEEQHGPQSDYWGRSYHVDEDAVSGPTPLIAAMRCYVASKLGDNVEIPTELGGTN